MGFLQVFCYACLNLYVAHLVPKVHPGGRLGQKVASNSTVLIIRWFRKIGFEVLDLLNLWTQFSNYRDMTLNRKNCDKKY